MNFLRYKRNPADAPIGNPVITHLLKKLRDYDARVKFRDRTRIVTNYDPSRPRWVAYVGVFGHDVVGEGNTKLEAATAAVQSLPTQYARHFV